ncbi:MAG: ATP phosphoribosyltransferase [Acutalibacteraceae bacterium]|nr:ATP phosphoribosyltransferase [Acutalibacteraceae bacterium]
MNLNELSLSFNERVIFTLRELYRSYGYSQYKMSKFEEYDLYARNKDFLISDSVITFTDTNGKLMALKPDVTLSIIKHIKENACGVQKLFYNENVYRISKDNDSFKELMQVGLECVGDIADTNIAEVITLAAKSLKSISDSCVLDISHLGILTAQINALDISKDDTERLLKCMDEKNFSGLKALNIPEKALFVLGKLINASGKASEVIGELESSLKDICDTAPLSELTKILSQIDPEIRDMIRVDFSSVCDINYYNGIVFKGFIDGVPSAVLSGGQYDKLMKKMKRQSGAIGFAVYLDMLNLTADTKAVDNTLNIALPKGRLGEKVYAMFEAAGFPCTSIKENNRKLIFENGELGIRYFWVKPSDVAIYVERGAADIGVAGKDILLEYNPDVYELSDLNIGKCRMAVAAKSDFCDNTDRALRVATKFTNIARSHYMSKGRDIDIIHLNGSIEIAPILGLSDVIVDIVETGTTLKENNLEVIETVVPISARLISNKASFKFKSKKIQEIVEKIAEQTEAL